jgi:branched-chain amino acid transport system ATP-binding protein
VTVPDVVLTAAALEKRFGGLRAVAEVSLQVRSGEIHAIIGPNGAGKSTLINLLSGDLRPTSGVIMLGDVAVTGLAPDRRALAGISRSYQKTTIFPHFTVFENVRLAAQACSSRPLQMIQHVRRDKAVHEQAQEALRMVELRDRSMEMAGTLSHGEQRQLEIAMVLATNPSVVLLDEPLAGVGHDKTRTIVQLIASLKGDRAVLLVEHDMDAVFALADRLTVMANGRVIASGAPDGVRTDPVVRAAYLGSGEPDRC